MKLTRGSEYAILGVLYLARQGEGQVSMLSAIAEAQKAPPQFLAKILQSLARAGVVKSYRGAKGGFSLLRPASEVSMKDVIEAIEGPIFLSRDLSSPVHVIWEQAQEKMMDVLSRATFADLAKAEQQQETFAGLLAHLHAHWVGLAPGHPAPMAPTA